MPATTRRAAGCQPLRRRFLNGFSMSSIAKSKEELQSAIEIIFLKLLEDYRVIPVDLSRKISIEGNIKDTEISVCDTIAYLIGWGKLVLKWHQHEQQGLSLELPETGFQWNELGLLASSFHTYYKDWGIIELLNEFEATVEQVQAMLADLTNEELYGKLWYKKYTFGRMVQLNTSAPMKNMRAKVRRFKKVNGIQ